MYLLYNNYNYSYSIVDVLLHKKSIIESNHLSVPGNKILQSFAAIIASRWQCLASPLSLTSEDIVSIKRETRGAEPTRQALVMLHGHALFVFHICTTLC